MSRRRLDRVVEAAERTVTRVMRQPEIGALFAGLPMGSAERMRPPIMDPHEWPEELFPAVAGVRSRR
jgi:hypothetical protein